MPAPHLHPPGTGRATSACYSLGLLAAILLLAGCGAPDGAGVPSGASETRPPVFTAAAEGDGNELKVSVEGETAVVDVQSRSGIGAATVELASGTPPETIVVRLHVSGLESFRLSYEQTTITVAVSSSDSRSILQEVSSPDGGTSPLTFDSPLWLDIRAVSEQATPTIPLQQGYFEIRLPKQLLSDRQRSFTIRWIDFYR
jgi:hypothetical protein